VFHNRLKKNWRLGTDPTVIYATLLANDFKWDGKIHKTDLQRNHPYNTYVVFGLPPGPIANPGAAAPLPKDEQGARIRERNHFVDMLETRYQLTQARLSLLRAMGRIEDWAKSTPAPRP